MERLTIPNETRYFRHKKPGTPTWEAIECLAEYEDKLESGQLVEFPVKVGDIVYLPCFNDWGAIEHYSVVAVGMDSGGSFFVVDDEDKDIHRIDIIGKKVFLTSEAAKARLKELQEKRKWKDIYTTVDVKITADEAELI